MALFIKNLHTRWVLGASLFYFWVGLKPLKKKVLGEQDGGGVGGHGIHLSTDTSGIHLQTQEYIQNTS